MIITVQPNTLGTLNPNDKFEFENNTDTHYFIGNYGVSGFVSWNNIKKKVVTIKNLNYDEYLNLKIHKV